MMQLSPRGRALIQEFERLRLVAFKPTPDDVWTVGWGHTGDDVHEGLVWTRVQADDAFDFDIGKYVRQVIASTDVPLTQNQFDALVSFTYNEGVTAEGHSTLLKYVNQRRWLDAANEFPRWNKQKGKVLDGLTRRRDAERTLFLEGLA
jgi:lysozyme